MNTKFLYSLVAIMLFSILLSFQINDNFDPKNKLLLQFISKTLEFNHYENVKFDDEFSKKSFDLYITKLDYFKRFFLQSDIDKMSQYREKIDDEIKNETDNFFELSYQIFNERLKIVERYYKEILSKPFDFQANENIELEVKKNKFSTDTVQLFEIWRKSMKYETMLKLSAALQQQEDALAMRDTSYKKKSFAEMEVDARQKVKKTMDDWFHRVNKLSKQDRMNLYFNSLTGALDPHTEYFPPEDKANFDISISGKLEGIGAQLQEGTDGYIRIAGLVPGSPSWKNGKLKVGDIILKVAQGAAEAVSIVDMRIDDVVKLVRGKKGTEVRLTIKKREGESEIVSLIREEIILQETFAKSTIIQDADKNTKVGYIYLPKFYTDFNDKNGRTCSKDIAAEVQKLKDENVDGIVLDLRDNGGGSLQDVVEMVDLFIKSGPVVQVQPRKGFPQVMASRDAGILYEGALVVMVNAFSASASEIFAAAIQDYKRGIIVGSPQTFGKGTVQRFIDFDEIIRDQKLSEFKPLGSIKISMQKFYRINGGATQLKGVSSDIVLPDNYMFTDIGERELDNPMPWDQISAANYSEWKPSFDMEKVKKLSKKRIDGDKDFQLIAKNAKRLQKQKESTSITLNLEKFRKEEQKRKKEAKKFEVDKKETGLIFEMSKADASRMQNDSTSLNRMKAWQTDLKKDMYVKEVFQMMKDIKKN